MGLDAPVLFSSKEGAIVPLHGVLTQSSQTFTSSVLEFPGHGLEHASPKSILGWMLP